MKIKGAKVEQGIKIKAAGLSESEKEIITKAIRKIKYGRGRNKRPPLPYRIKLK